MIFETSQDTAIKFKCDAKSTYSKFFRNKKNISWYREKISAARNKKCELRGVFPYHALSEIF